MQRLIRSFNTLTDELKETLQEQYPDGIDSSHIKTIPTAKGDVLRVIELRTPDALYLIKINAESRAEIEEFLDQDNDSGSSGDDMDDESGMEGADDIEGGGDDDMDDDDGGDDEDGDDGDDEDDDGDDEDTDEDDGKDDED